MAITLSLIAKSEVAQKTSESLTATEKKRTTDQLSNTTIEPKSNANKITQDVTSRALSVISSTSLTTVISKGLLLERPIK